MTSPTRNMSVGGGGGGHVPDHSQSRERQLLTEGQGWSSGATFDLMCQKKKEKPSKNLILRQISAMKGDL